MSNEFASIIDPFPHAATGEVRAAHGSAVEENGNNTSGGGQSESTASIPKFTFQEDPATHPSPWTSGVLASVHQRFPRASRAIGRSLKYVQGPQPRINLPGKLDNL